MKYSVAMCTYNGSRYVRQQLDSIVRQSLLPEEVVVCDDCSTDGTAALIEDFRSAAQFSVRLHVNEERLGVVENFGRAIARCNGDVIALCDQDDVWRDDKLRRIHEVLSSNPRVGAVFSDAEVVDEDLHPLGYRLWEAFNFGPREQVAVNRGRSLRLLMPRNLITGATIAFRSRFKDLILPIPTDTFWIHDGWIALMIATVADLAAIPEPLLLYRQHGSQQMGAAPPGSAANGFEASLARARRYRSEHYATLAHQFSIVLDRLEASKGRYEIDKRAIKDLQAKIRHCEARARLPDRKVQRLPVVLHELASLRYHRYSSGVRSAAKDLVF